MVVCASVLVFATGLHRELSLATLIRHRAAINAFVAERPLAAFLGFVALYIGVVALSVPGAALLTVSGGLLFGPLAGGLGAFIGATTGASLIFFIGRSALGGWLVKRAGPFAEKLADGFRRGAFSYLLFLRLVPLFPFWLVNIAPALFGVRFAVFVGATALGIIPLTFAFALFGAGLDSAIAAQASAYQACLAAGHEPCRIDFDLRLALTPELIAALAAVGVVALVPLAVKRWRAARGRNVA
ncbi:MAG: TVP38/TMEM64 family protein [Rhodoplanes sp.]